MLRLRLSAASRRSGKKPSGVFKGRRLDLLVIRVNKDGVLRNAKPCHSCTRLLKRVGWLRHVYWSVDSSSELLEFEKVEKLASGHVSPGQIYRFNGRRPLHRQPDGSYGFYNKKGKLVIVTLSHKDTVK